MMGAVKETSRTPRSRRLHASVAGQRRLTVVGSLLAVLALAAGLGAGAADAATRQVGPASDDPVLEGPVPENGGPTRVEPPGSGEPPPTVTQPTGDVLTTRGVELSALTVTPTVAEVSRTITLGGDVPLATYVVSRISGLPLLQRNNLGYWVPWDGSPDTLIDNHFLPVGDQLTFKILKEDISEQFFPISFIIAYRTEAGLKRGVFNVVPK